MKSFEKLPKSWIQHLAAWKDGEDYKKLTEFLESEKKSKKVLYPKPSEVYSAFSHTPFDQVKVVILGQDPYHGEGQAHGLSFSVNKGVKIPPSLRNIFKELESDLEILPATHGNLIKWAKQGVLLLNNVLTVKKSNAGSHQKKGWESFTDLVIEKLSSEKSNLVFLLWGAPAQKKAKSVDKNKHLILEAPHPSPLSSYRGFFGCKHFSKTNEYLKAKGIPPIDWELEK